MKLITRSLMLCCFILVQIVANAQTSVGGKIDSVADQFGNWHPVTTVLIPPSAVTGGSGGSSQSLIASSCSSGYFQLYYAVGSGLEDSTSTAALARRAILCQLFSDLSAFISSPLTTTGNKVNVLISDIHDTGKIGYWPNLPSNTVAVATSYYHFPFPITPNIPTAHNQVVDNSAWITIHSGKDAFLNTLAPLATNNNASISGATPSIHINIAFDFNRAFNTDLSRAPTTGEFDMYSVALHEVMHALGFSSAINSRGLSVLSATWNPTYYEYYTRYDTKLKDQTGHPLILLNSSCSSYGADFNYPYFPSNLNYPDIDVLAPSPFSCVNDYTNCSNAIYYVSNLDSVPVYTPNCFTPGSSLSHFEDECLPTSANNLYYVMSNSYGTGPTSMKRYLKPEERNVLCDIGYSVATTYGNTSDSTYKSYGGSACPGIDVAGTNDGLDSGYYRYEAEPGESITILDALANDHNATRMECLELIVGVGKISKVGNTRFTYTPDVASSDSQRVHILRYVPVNAAGDRGNITYILVHVDVNNCKGCSNQAATAMVSNGGFEVARAFSLDSINCWYDCFYPALIDTGTAYLGHQFATLFQIGGISSSPGTAITRLGSPAMPGGTYVLTYHVRANNAYIIANGSPYLPGFYFDTVFHGFPNYFYSRDTTYVASSGGWNTITDTFTYPLTKAPTQLAYLAFSVLTGSQNSIDLDEVTMKQITAPYIPKSASALLSYYNALHDTISTNNKIYIDSTFTVDANLTLRNCPFVYCKTASNINIYDGPHL